MTVAAKPMAYARNRPIAPPRRGFRGSPDSGLNGAPDRALYDAPRAGVGVRFPRFAAAAIAALAATEIALTAATGVFRLTATPAALASWFAGAVVSYGLSRWAWERTGRPDVLRETLPCWLLSVLVLVLLTLANRLGYGSAAWLHLAGARHVLWVDLVWLLANLGTFLLRFLIFHFVLFTDRPGPLGGNAAAAVPATRYAAPPG